MVEIVCTVRRFKKFWGLSDKREMSTASGNSTTFFNDVGIALLSPDGVVQLTASSITLAGTTTLTSALSAPSLTVSGSSTMQSVAAQALSATTGTFSGALTTAASAAVSGNLSVQGSSTLAAATLSGSLSVAGASTLQGPLSCAAAVSLQSLSVAAGSTLQGTLAVGGASAFAGLASFVGGITCASNTTVSAYDLACSDNVTVGNVLKVSSNQTQSVQIVNPSTNASQALQIYLDRTAASASANASLTLTPSLGLLLATNSATVASISTATQQVSVTANRQGDTLRVYGDGSISSATELFLDNSAKASTQFGRIGCDSTGMYLSPGTLAKAVFVNYAGLLTASKGLAVTNSLTSDNVTVSGTLTAATATLQSATLGSLNCNSLTASSGSPLALYGGDSAKTVTVPGTFLASTISGLSGSAITLTGSDSHSSTIVSGRLQVDTVLTNAANSLTVVPQTTFQANVVAPTMQLTGLQITAALSNSALTNYDCTSTASGFKASAGVVPGVGYQLSVNSSAIFGVSPSTKLTTFNNAVQLSGALTVNSLASLTAGLSVAGASSFNGIVAPQTDASQNLGSASLRWAGLFISGSVALPNAATFSGKLSDLTQDSLMLQGQEVINFNGPRGLVIKNASSTASSTADIVFDRSAISNAQVGGIGMGGDTAGLFLSTNNAQRINIGVGGLVGVGGVTGVSPLTLAASTTASGYKANGLYVYNSNTSSTASAQQNAIITTQVQSQNNTALAFNCFDNTVYSWSLGMRGNDSKLYLAPSNSGPYTGQKLSIDQSGNVVLGGGLLIADGSVTLPAYGFSSDNNNDTGFYHPGEGVIAVANNGVQSMTWNSDASVSMLKSLSVATNVTCSGLTCSGYGTVNNLAVAQTTTLAGQLTAQAASSLTDTTITSATTTSSMLRLVGTSSSQAEASVTFNRTGTNSIVWSLGQGAYSVTDDFCIGGAGQGGCLQIAASSGFVSMRHSYGTSDRDQKKDIRECRSGLDWVCATKPVEYRWKSGGDDKVHWGFIAQDIDQIVDSEAGIVGHYTQDGLLTKSLAYTELIAPMARAIQQLKAMVHDLQYEVSVLRHDLDDVQR